MFKIEAECGNARAGILITENCEVKTPFFMPVATKGVGKFIGSDDYNRIGIRSIISNSFILSQTPGLETLKNVGGIHNFSGFRGCIFTDSGGFQMSRPGFFVGTGKRGIRFKIPNTKKIKLVTPKIALNNQRTIGSNVAMMLDDMADPNSSKEEFQKAMQHTFDWAKEIVEEHKKFDKKDIYGKRQLLFGIVQGGYDAKLREECAKYIDSLEFDGNAIGGCAIGEPKPEMYIALNSAIVHLSKNKIRYFMGVGSPEDCIVAIGKGVDCFDSVYPTMNARHRRVFTFNGPLDIDTGIYKFDSDPIDKKCKCDVCKQFSKNYLYHLMKENEPEGKRLLSHHNIAFMKQLFDEARKNIIKGTFEEFKHKFLKDWFKGNEIPEYLLE